MVGLSQVDVDIAMGRGMGTYQKVESGSLRPSPEYLLQLARTLRLTESEYVQAHLDLFGTEPGQCLDPGAGLGIPDAWKRAVDGQREMAYVNDRCWNVRYYNEAFAEWFAAGRPPENLARWFLLSDEARDELLVDWDTEWGPLLVPQFRVAFARLPHDPVLQAIHHDVLRDPRVRPLYERGDRAYLHPDGDRRPARHRRHGRGWLTMVAAQPFSSPGARAMVLLFDPADRHTGPFCGNGHLGQRPAER